MDLLKQEIMERKRKLEELKVVDAKKTFFRRGELAKREEEAYLERQRASQANGALQQQQRRRRQGDVDGGSDDGGGSGGGGGGGEMTNRREAANARALAELSSREVARRLRTHRAPIRLFGETDEALRQRLKIVEAVDTEEDKGLRNDLQAAMEKVDEEYLREWMAKERQQQQHEASDPSGLDVQTKEADIDEEEKLDMIEQLSSGRLDERQQTDMVLKFFKYLLCLWGRKLNSRPSNEKQTSRGRMASARYTQTVAYIQPLFKSLKGYRVGVDIADSLAGIVQQLLARNYIEANAAYMELAIGNAPWPLGVTNHGIHTRPAQAGIYAKNVAHVLNDETQRKYIQSIKRLMSLAQEMFPTDPHRCVNFMGPDTPSYGQ